VSADMYWADAERDEMTSNETSITKKTGRLIWKELPRHYRFTVLSSV
jgi:hypothetical protein